MGHAFYPKWRHTFEPKGKVNNMEKHPLDPRLICEWDKYSQMPRVRLTPNAFKNYLVQKEFGVNKNLLSARIRHLAHKGALRGVNTGKNYKARRDVSEIQQLHIAQVVKFIKQKRQATTINALVRILVDEAQHKGLTRRGFERAIGTMLESGTIDFEKVFTNPVALGRLRQRSSN